MRANLFSRVAGFAFATSVFLFIAAPSSFAQEEGVPQVVDEVIAQVNNDVVTLSMVRREMKQAVETLKGRGMNEAQANEEAEKNRAKIIANLINEQLILQKGKEIPRLTEEVEAEVNREMLRVAKKEGIKTLEQLEDELRRAGLVPEEIRQTLRVQFTQQAVLQREVDAKIYYAISEAEARKFFDANKEKFRKPESLELSEIFLSLAGKPEAEVKAKAEGIVAQARGGADFGQLAAQHSERELNGVRVAPESKGKVGTFQLPDIRPNIAAVVKGLKKGGVSDPVRFDDGYQIVRVDDRSEGGGEPVYNEQQARGAITQERSEKERENYLLTLHKDAYVKLAPGYEATVTPLLPKAVNTSPNKQTGNAKKS